MGNAEFELEMMLPDERKERDRQTVFSKGERSYHLDEPGISTGKMKVTCIFLSLQVLFVN